jgi:rRNA-processing protein FCF1
LKSDYVDKGIIDYAKKHKDVIIATMDVGIKKNTKNQKLVVRAKKKLMVI